MEYTNDSAPSFEALLRGVAADLQVGFDFDDPAQIRGKSLSAIAADLEQARAEALAAEADIEEPPRKAAHRELREAKRRRCNLSVDEDKRAHFQAAQARLLPSWVITTNYDLVLEQLLRRSISLGPTARVVARADAPPVLHLHGRITEPETIVVTDNDYVAALRPTSYAFFKLPVLLAESTTLLLGYGLGDVNVRQAVLGERLDQLRRSLEQSLRSVRARVADVARLVWVESPREHLHRGVVGRYELTRNHPFYSVPRLDGAHQLGCTVRSLYRVTELMRETCRHLLH